MRIALCLSGLPRDFKAGFPSLKKYILNELKPDIFISTWDWRHKEEDHHGGEKDATIEEFREAFKKTKLLKGFEVEDWNETMEENFKTDELSVKYGKAWPRRLAAMHYKIFKANQLCACYEQIQAFQYDIVIRCRPDLIFSNSIPEIELNDIITNQERNLIYIRQDSINPKNESNDGKWLHDQFWFGSSGAMDNSSLTVFAVETYFTKASLPSPELVLRANLDNWGCKTKPSAIRYILSREKNQKKLVPLLLSNKRRIIKHKA